MRRVSETRKRGLGGVVSSILFTAGTLVVAVSVLAFLATRSHMFHIAYSTRKQYLENSGWLVEQCKTSDFYSNMKQHSTLCDDVALAQTDSLWLHALRDVIDQTNVCGDASCMQTVQNIVFWILGRGLMSMTVISACLVIVFVVAVHLHRWLSSQHLYDNTQLHITASNFPTRPAHSQYALMDEGYAQLPRRTSGS
jgi:hypothetical protein